MAKLCLVQDCPVFNDIGPYIYIVTHDAHATVNSIYRGDEAEHLLNQHGHHSQRQLVNATPTQRVEWGILGTPDPVDETTHCKRNDGIAYPHWPIRAHLAWWCQGFDVQSDDVNRVIHQGARHGWVIGRRYNTTAELHHCNFLEQPRPGPRTLHRIYYLRHRLPRH